MLFRLDFLLFLAVNSSAVGVREMRKIFDWLVLIALAALTVKLGMWAYQGLKGGDSGTWQEEVPAYQTDCYMLPDTGQCLCQHVETRARVALSYDECVARSTNAPGP